MKFSKFFGAALVAGTVMAASAVSAFAADTFTIGDPINLSNGNTIKVEEIKSGMFLAFPVDVTTSTSNVKSFTLNADIDSSVLSGGIALADASSLSSIGSLGVAVLNEEKTNVDAIDNLSLFGSRMCSVGATNLTATKAGYTAYYATAANVNASKPEFYLLFTATGDFVDDGTLNKSLFTIDGASSNINVTDTLAPNPDVDQAKANACEAAFKIVLKDADLETYIYNLYVKVGSGEAQKLTEYVSDKEKEYEFRVRLVDNTGNLTSVPVTILADTGDNATDGATNTGVELSSFNVDLTKTYTDYEAH